MITSGIDDHVSAIRHVAIHTHRSGRAGNVVVMRRYVVLTGGVLVTRGAGLVSGVLQFQRMGIVTISAADAFVIHPALYKGTVHIDFVLDLTIGVISVFLQQFEAEMVAKSITRLETACQHAASAMTRRASLQLWLGIVAFETGKRVTIVAVPEQ